MSTPPTDGPAPDRDEARWGDPSTRVSLDKPADRPAAQAFDPYRFGAPDHPVPPEYAPPGYPGGYVPPPPMPTTGPDGPALGSPQPTYQPFGYAPPQYPPQQYPPQYGAQYPPPPYSPYPRPRTGNGKAIAALVLGILSILFSLLSLLDLALIIPAIVLGSLGLSDAKRTGSGRGLAVAGFVCATIGAVLAATLTIWLYPQVQRCVNDYPSNSTEYNDCIRNIVR